VYQSVIRTAPVRADRGRSDNHRDGLSIPPVPDHRDSDSERR
jgi:hypothetical protein